jgi:tetratricopeptide (TPR) repeat protein
MGGEIDTKTSQVYIPFAAALLFATHPIHAEAVTVGTAEVSFAFFYLLSFYLYVRADMTGRGVPVSSLVFFFIAALSKETALTLPILLFAYDYSFKRDSTFHLTLNALYLLLKRYLPYLIVAGIYFILRTYAIGGFSPVELHASLSTYEYLINIFPLFVQYVEKLILPVNLTIFYAFRPVYSILEWEAITTLLLTLAFMTIVYFLRNRNNVALFCLLWIIIALLPVLYIPALGHSTFTERYLYLPSAGFVIFVSIGLYRVGRSNFLSRRTTGFLVIAAFVAIAALYSVTTIKRNRIWYDDITMRSYAVAKAPDYHVPYLSLGNAYYREGMVDEAIEAYRSALRLKPDYVKAYRNLGRAYNRKGMVDEAIKAYRSALRLKPDYVWAHNDLGNAYFKKAQYEEALEEYREALKIKPGLAGTHLNMGNVYYIMGRTDEAIDNYRTALRLAPDLADARFNLALAYKKKGLNEEAIKEFERVLEARPRDKRARKILEGLLAER